MKRQIQKEAPKQNQEAMKTVVLTSSSSSSSSSVKSTATATSSNMDDDRSETRDSCYFPGCRKDANCKCEMCLASINATLDLMPASIHRSSLTKFSASKPVPRSPVAFNPSILSTPRSSAPRVSETPPLTSTARMSFHEKVRRKKRRMGFGFIPKRLILGLSLIFSAEFGFSWLVSGVLTPELSPGIVRNLSEKSRVLQNVNEKLEFLQRELKGLVNGKVSDCSSSDSSWQVSQDDLLLCSRCTLYKSFTEEVSIWGWPLQTAGLLTAEFSSRSLTILMGRITEWSDGKSSYSTKIANQSWVQQKWSASAVQLDRNTWILEHRLARVVENSRLISAALEFLKLKLSMELKRMKQEFWLLHAFGDHYNDLAGGGFKVPT